MFPKMDDVIVENNVGVKEDAGVFFRKHVGQEESGRGTDLEHPNHLGQTRWICHLSAGQGQFSLVVHFPLGEGV